MAETLTIDIVSDVVCPWCYVGKKHLERALDSLPEIDAVIRWHPFQLDPTIPKEGVDRQAYMTKKFGDGDYLKSAHARIEKLGAENGIDFKFGAIKRSPNTLDAHRVIRWAKETGVEDEIVSALFKAYFEDGRDIGDSDILAHIAASVGMDGDGVKRLLETDTDTDSVMQEIAEAGRIGVTGVPFFILASRLAVSGAQPANILIDAIRQAMAP
jgi:predicted DsbA family dithiol-disulfide isomerase